MAMVQIFHLLTLVDMFGKQKRGGGMLTEFLGWLLLFFHDISVLKNGQMDRFMLESLSCACDSVCMCLNPVVICSLVPSGESGLFASGGVWKLRLAAKHLLPLLLRPSCC